MSYIFHIDYQTADLTASGGEDFLTKSGTIIFEPDKTTHEIIVQLRDDSVFEGDESFFIQLIAPSGKSGTRLGLQKWATYKVTSSVTLNFYSI